MNVAGEFSSLDAHTGEPHWTQQTQGGRVLAVGRTRIYLQSHDGDLFIMDRATGRIIADPRATRERSGLNMREFHVDLTNNVNDRIYIATASGIIMCLREIGEATPMLYRDPNLPIFGYLPPNKKVTVEPSAAVKDDDGEDAPKAKAAPKAEKKKAEAEEEGKEEGKGEDMEKPEGNN